MLWVQNGKVMGPVTRVTLFTERRFVVRFEGKSRLGFYPLPLSESQRIRRLLHFPINRRLRSTHALPMA
jgi:hypothetical protein